MSASTALHRCYAAVLATSLLCAVLWSYPLWPSGTDRPLSSGRCSRSPEAPSFAAPIDNQTVSLHRDVTLACVVNHLGTHQVAWLHIEQRQSLISIGERRITQLPQYSVHHDHQKTWTLRIRKVKREDGGLYMCQVNTKPMLTQNGYVFVVEPPNIIDSQSSPSEVSVHEGQSVRLKCHADGQPAPSITWKREDSRPLRPNRPELWHNSSVLVLEQVSRKLTGAYLCIANNGVPPSPSKMVTLKVEFAPSIRVDTQLHGAPPGTSVTLTCYTEAQPRAIHYWTHRGNMLLSTPHKYRIEDVVNGYRTTMKLTVHDLNDSDFDIYRCVSKNSFGEAQESIRVYATRLERPRAPPAAAVPGQPPQPPQPPPQRRPQQRAQGEPQLTAASNTGLEAAPGGPQVPEPAASSSAATERPQHLHYLMPLLPLLLLLVRPALQSDIARDFKMSLLLRCGG